MNGQHGRSSGEDGSRASVSCVQAAKDTRPQNKRRKNRAASRRKRSLRCWCQRSLVRPVSPGGRSHAAPSRHRSWRRRTRLRGRSRRCLPLERPDQVPSTRRKPNGAALFVPLPGFLYATKHCGGIDRVSGTQQSRIERRSCSGTAPAYLNRNEGSLKRAGTTGAFLQTTAGRTPFQLPYKPQTVVCCLYGTT